MGLPCLDDRRKLIQHIPNVEFPEVVTVKPNTFHEEHTTRSWDFLGVDNYQSPQQSGLLQKAKYGEDVIVGVIDSGLHSYLKLKSI
jgi:hypothetical protein